MHDNTDEKLYQSLVAINTIIQFFAELEKDYRVIWSNGQPAREDYPLMVGVHNEYGDVELSLIIKSPETFVVQSYNEGREFADSLEAVEAFKEKYRRLS